MKKIFCFDFINNFHKHSDFLQTRFSKTLNTKLRNPTENAVETIEGVAEIALETTKSKTKGTAATTIHHHDNCVRVVEKGKSWRSKFLK